MRVAHHIQADASGALIHEVYQRTAVLMVFKMQNLKSTTLGHTHNRGGTHPDMGLRAEVREYLAAQQVHRITDCMDVGETGPATRRR